MRITLTVWAAPSLGVMVTVASYVPAANPVMFGWTDRVSGTVPLPGDTESHVGTFVVAVNVSGADPPFVSDMS